MVRLTGPFCQPMRNWLALQHGHHGVGNTAAPRWWRAVGTDGAGKSLGRTGFIGWLAAAGAQKSRLRLGSGAARCRAASRVAQGTPTMRSHTPWVVRHRKGDAQARTDRRQLAATGVQGGVKVGHVAVDAGNDAPCRRQRRRGPRASSLRQTMPRSALTADSAKRAH